MIGQGHVTIGEFAGTLRALGLVDARLLVHGTAGARSLVTVVVNAGPEVSAAVNETHDYGEVALAKAVLPADELADWITRGHGAVGTLTFTVPEPAPVCYWGRWEGRTYADHGTYFATPRTEYRVLPQRATAPSSPGTVLAGSGLRFFPDLRIAAASALFDVHSMPGGISIPSDMMLVRIAHTGAYFSKVRVSSASIVAKVLGDDLDDVHLQVSSAGRHYEELVGQPRDVRVSVDGADSTDA